ncbi:phage tail assembly chaperone [Thioclava sp. DLFJ5-1]|uniref:phage tail assembly chaperone n=1 Tax=Thioclava sp. DLFJ5-1 TaxID=1915314 RepID=UPI000996C9DE|nr:phage tail assembly chaperone [Thioclava sp. DLFJ5-1]
MAFVWINPRTGRTTVSNKPPHDRDVPYGECADHETADSVYYDWDHGTARAVPRSPGSGHVFDPKAGAWRDTRTDEQLAHALRVRRDQLLRESDGLLANDRPLRPGQRIDLVDYRQALRDLPETVTDMRNPVWPTMPD